jgi:hypothetical protein
MRSPIARTHLDACRDSTLTKLGRWLPWYPLGICETADERSGADTDLRFVALVVGSKSGRRATLIAFRFAAVGSRSVEGRALGRGVATSSRLRELLTQW